MARMGDIRHVRKILGGLHVRYVIHTRHVIRCLLRVEAE
jgi:hypothetical protein